VLAADIEALWENHDVDVDTEAETQFTYVIVRDYWIPSGSYSQETIDVRSASTRTTPRKLRTESTSTKVSGSKVAASFESHAMTKSAAGWLFLGTSTNWTASNGNPTR